MLCNLFSCLFFGVAWAMTGRIIYDFERSPSIALCLCFAALLATCIDRGIAFLLAAVQAWRSRNESYTAAGPWLVAIREGGAP